MAISDGKTPADEGRRAQAPSSHAVRSVNARIQAGPVWTEIVRSDQLPEPVADASSWQRLIAWRRSVPTSHLIGFGALAAAAIMTVNLASSPYRWPTLPDPGVNIAQLVMPQGNNSDDQPAAAPASESSSVSLPKAPQNPASKAPSRSATPIDSTSPSFALVGVSSSIPPSSTATPSVTPSPTDSTEVVTTGPTSPSPTSPSPTETTPTTTASATTTETSASTGQ